MQITIKTLRGTAFTIEKDLNETVIEAKRSIEQVQGPSFPSDQLKLIHKGKVMKDEEKLSEYSIKEGDFIVCMVSKPTKKATEENANTSASAIAPNATTAATSSASRTSAPAIAPSSVSTSATTAANEQQRNNGGGNVTGSTTTTTASTTTGSSASATVNPMIQQLCDMGFPEEQVRQALRVAFNNPDRAVEYLTNGIPQNILSQMTAGPNTMGTGGENQGQGQGQIAGDPPLNPNSGADALQALRRIPGFNSYRQLLQSNPEALPEVLNQIGRIDPRLLTVIHANQDAFIRMLNEPITTNEGEAAPNLSMPPVQNEFIRAMQTMTDEQWNEISSQMGIPREQAEQFRRNITSMPPEALQELLAIAGLRGGEGAFPGAGMQRPPQTVIQLTPEENEAVMRLCDLGFDRSDAVQAYIACDKNESLAANLLMDGTMFDEPGTSGSGGASSGSSGHSQGQGNSGADGGDDIYE